jgi:hypothetical protein
MITVSHLIKTFSKYTQPVGSFVFSQHNVTESHLRPDETNTQIYLLLSFSILSQNLRLDFRLNFCRHLPTAPCVLGLTVFDINTKHNLQDSKKLRSFSISNFLCPLVTLFLLLQNVTFSTVFPNTRFSLRNTNSTP